MKQKTALRKLMDWICSGLAALTAGVCIAQAPSVNPLQISMTRVGETAGPLQAQVSLHNAGDRDLILNLGMMLGNGTVQYLNAVHLRLVDEHGKTLILDLIGPAIIAGRVDPLIVPLPKDATFSFLVKLADYDSPRANVWKIELAPSTYTVSAEYKGAAVPQRAANLDMEGVALMPYWTGRAESKALSFTVPAERRKHE